MAESALSERNPQGLSKLRHINWRQLPVAISVVVMIITGVYASSLSSSPRLSIVDNNTTLLRSQDTYERAAGAILASSVWNKSKLSIDTVALGDQLQKEFPELAAVSVTVPLLGRQPTLQLISEKPALIVNVAGSDYYVNSSGLVIMRVDDAVERPQVLRMADQVGLQARVGEQLLPRDTVSFTMEVVRQLAARNVAIDSVALPALPNELQVRPAGRPYYVKLTTLGDARLQSGTYLALMNKLDADRIAPKEYVDVRVEERAYYK